MVLISESLMHATQMNTAVGLNWFSPPKLQRFSSIIHAIKFEKIFQSSALDRVDIDAINYATKYTTKLRAKFS